MARARFTGRFSEQMRAAQKAREKPLEEKPTQRGSEPLQRVRERLVRKALAIHNSSPGIGVDQRKLPVGRKGIRFPVANSKSRK